MGLDGLRVGWYIVSLGCESGERRVYTRGIEILRQMVATNASGATCWSNFELTQVKPHTIGQIWNQCIAMQVTFFLAGEITQVKESIPWVRCTSGNVLLASCQFVQLCLKTSND